jgi:ABC-2 type transport system permease protein
MTRLLRIHLLEAKYEFLKLFRIPGFVVPTVMFPLLFYVFFGIGLGAQRDAAGVTLGRYLIATYGAFGVIGASLFGFGITVATERGQGWLQVKRTTPMPISAYFFAKMVMAMLFSAIIITGLFILGLLAGHATMPVTTALELYGVLLAGSITFCSLGLAVGYLAGPNSAAPIVNLIYLPMSFLSGLWIPIWVLPKMIQKIAVVLPPFHFSQIALWVIGAGRGGPMLPHVLVMVVATILFLALAYVGYRRDEGKMYG